MFFKKKEEVKKGKVQAAKKESEQPAAQQADKSAKPGTQKAVSNAPNTEQAAPRILTPAQIRERMQQGWFRTLITFELVGKPREHIETTLKAYLANIKLDERIAILKEEYAEAMEHEDGLFSAFCETEALVEDLEVLTWLAINFMPASIEVQEPERLGVEARVITNWYNDLLSKLHETSNILREERAVNKHLTESLNALIKNGILAAVRDGPKQLAEIVRITGIQEAQLKPFLEHLVKKEKLRQQQDSYRLP